MLRLGFTPINILSETGQTTIESAMRGLNMTLGLRINADLMAKEEGDWVNNIYQGLGRTSTQYQNAIRFGQRCMNTKISHLEDKCLNITGH